MKFNKIITSFFSIAAASLLVAACGSNEQTAVDEAGKIDLAQEMTFKIEAEEYQTAPAKNATRAAGKTVQPQEIDLGNGLVAELTIEPDTNPRHHQRRALPHLRFKQLRPTPYRPQPVDSRNGFGWRIHPRRQ